jgi:hypothetical protein
MEITSREAQTIAWALRLLMTDPARPMDTNITTEEISALLAKIA